MLFYIPNVCYVSDMTLLIDGNNRLKPRREHLGISRKALSVCTGIPLRSIQYYEEEKEQRLSFEEIEKLSKRLKMDTFQLLKEFPREIEYKTKDINNGNDDSGSGYMQLFNPSSTTFVKHYLSNLQISHETPRSMNWLSAGYGNTTSAITGVQFKFDSGNIDAGDICLYGIA